MERRRRQRLFGKLPGMIVNLQAYEASRNMTLRTKSLWQWSPDASFPVVGVIPLASSDHKPGYINLDYPWLARHQRD
jgi:hypothetical protein